MPIKIRVRNFQSIADAEITVEGLTVVTGTNNAGKSAFFRAIRGAFTNARGYDFVRYGESHCTVDMSFEGGETLTWKKGKNINTYVINGEELPKVGQGVPPEARVFGVESVVAGKMELWPQIAPQITGVSFLLHEPGSVIAEAVADVKRVNQLSRALAACEKDRRAARSQLKVRQADAISLAERSEKFLGLDAVVGTLSEIEDRCRKAEKVTKAFTNVVALQKRHKVAREAVGALEGLEDAVQALPNPQTLEAAQKLAQAIEVGNTLKTRWKGAMALVGSLEGLEETQASIPDPKRIEEAQGVYARLQEVRSLQERQVVARNRVTALEGVGAAYAALPSESRMEYAQQFRKGVQVTVELAVKVDEARREIQAAEAALTIEAFDEHLVLQASKYKKAWTNTRSLKDRYLQTRDTVTDLTQQIKDQEEELERLQEVFVTVLGGAEECPTCGGSLDHVH